MVITAIRDILVSYTIVKLASATDKMFVSNQVMDNTSPPMRLFPSDGCDYSYP